MALGATTGLRDAAGHAAGQPDRARRPRRWAPAATLILARALSSLLFGVPPWDPVALASAAALLALATLAASYLPARRAARVDPVSILASE